MSPGMVPASQLLPFVAFLLSFWRDPRKLRTGLYLLVALTWVVLGLVFELSGAVSQWNETAGALVLLAVVLLGLVMVVGFAGFLITTGLTLVRREGRRLSNLLSLGLGLALLAYTAVVVAVVAADSLPTFLWLVLVGLPAAYLGFAFTAFLLYGSLYPALMARSGGPVVAVVVLGSGLIEGRVPPLLASRLRKGRTVFDRLVTRGTPPRAMVTSGGRGPDEPVAEAEAMADFLVEDGLPADRVLREDRSRNTDENLANTATLLAEHGIDGPIAVVTSDFHAFRAALLMRRHGLAGYSVGAPTARYYWPSAVIREFIAVLRDHLWLNVVLLGLSLVPLVMALAGGLAGQR